MILEGIRTAILSDYLSNKFETKGSDEVGIIPMAFVEPPGEIKLSNEDTTLTNNKS